MGGFDSLNITADTNLLLRSMMGDDPLSASRARNVLLDANIIAVTLPTLCELVWVLTSVYKKSRTDIAIAIRTLINGATVRIDVGATTAGLAHLDAGGDFADGVIAFEGRRLGGNVFVTFDQQAAKIIATNGGAVDLLRTS